MFQIRDEIAAVNKEIREIKERPIGRDESFARVDAFIAHEQANAGGDMLHAMRLPGENNFLYTPPVERLVRTYLFPLLGEKLKAQILEAEKAEPGISEIERAKILDELDARKLQAELVEESIIRAAERAGFTMSRRANADPRATLAFDEDLPR